MCAFDITIIAVLKTIFFDFGLLSLADEKNIEKKGDEPLNYGVNTKERNHSKRCLFIAISAALFLVLYFSLILAGIHTTELLAMARIVSSLVSPILIPVLALLHLLPANWWIWLLALCSFTVPSLILLITYIFIRVLRNQDPYGV
jgi:hypothetical protein